MTRRTIRRAVIDDFERIGIGQTCEGVSPFDLLFPELVAECLRVDGAEF